MAYLGQDDKQNQANQPQQGGASAPGSSMVSGAGTTPLVGTGTNSVSASPAPTQAGPGAGGSGWTNIQSYLTANQGNTGSSDTLSKNVGNQFAQDQSNISSQAQDTQNQAQQAGQSNYMAPDTASQLLQQTSSMYGSNPAQQSQQYTDNVNQFRNDLTGSYGGPKTNSFNPVLSQNSQNYGQALGNDDQLNAMMGGFYNQAAGQNLTQGQSDLQNLLAVNDPAFQQTRQNLTQQYNQLSPWVQQQQDQTNQAINQAQQQYTGNQQQLSQYLMGQQNTDKSNLDKATQKWNDAYQSGNGQAMQMANQELQQLMQMSHAPVGNTSVYDKWNQDPGYWASHAQTPGMSSRPFDPNAYINKGTAATNSNVPGSTADRNNFNTISDILQNGTPAISFDPNSPQAATANYQQLYKDLAGSYKGNDSAYFMNPFNTQVNEWAPQTKADQDQMLKNAGSGAIGNVSVKSPVQGPQIRTR